MQDTKRETPTPQFDQADLIDNGGNRSNKRSVERHKGCTLIPDASSWIAISASLQVALFRDHD